VYMVILRVVVVVAVISSNFVCYYEIITFIRAFQIAIILIIKNCPFHNDI
jgi:hypothetical protein